MASDYKTHTYKEQNVNTQQATSTPPAATPAVSVSTTYLVINTPSAPGPL